MLFELKANPALNELMQGSCRPLIFASSVIAGPIVSCGSTDIQNSFLASTCSFINEESVSSRPSRD